MIKPSEKARVYEILANLNLHFEQALLNLRRLGPLNVFDKRSLKDLIIFVEEARAWTNSEIVGPLQLQEEAEWAEFNRLRILSERAFGERPGDEGVSKSRSSVRKRASRKDR